MARYTIRASNETGPVEFQERLTIEAALEKVKDLRAGHFQHITLINRVTGVEITDLEALMQDSPDAKGPHDENRPADAIDPQCYSPR